VLLVVRTERPHRLGGDDCIQAKAVTSAPTGRVTAKVARQMRRVPTRPPAGGAQLGKQTPYRRPREFKPEEGARVVADELAREILEARLIANLATFNPDGSIHLVAMWFLWDGEALLSPTHRRTRKARNLQRDPRATVMIDDSKGGFDLRGVTLVCEADIVDAPASQGLNRRVHLKYVTEPGLELTP
jgi:PPOX class probable F420-dependent enzyme